MTPPARRSRLREIALLALPIALGNISHTMVSLVDTLMVSRLGEVPLAALGASSAIFLVLFLSVSSLVQGVQVLCARRLGERRLQETGKTLHNGLLAGLLVGLVATIGGFFLPEVLLPLFSGGHTVAASSAAQIQHWGGANAEAIGTAYLHYRWGGGIWMVILVFVFKGFYWGVGITHLDLMVSLVVNVANIGLNYLLIFGHLGFPRLGAPGAGLASAIANALAILIYVSLATRREFRREYGTFLHLKGDWKLVRQILRLSLPRTIQGLAFGASAVFFAIIGHQVGEAGLAVSTVIWRFFGILVLIGVGLGTAISTLVGRELGRGDAASANAYVWTAVRLGAVTALVLGLLCALFARQILALFALPPPLVELAVPIFRLMVVLQVVDIMGITLSKALVGAGDVLYVMLAEICVSWGVCIPTCLLFLWLLQDSYPLLGAWCGWFAYMLAWFLAMLVRWRLGRWRGIKV